MTALCETRQLTLETFCKQQYAKVAKVLPQVSQYVKQVRWNVRGNHLLPENKRRSPLSYIVDVFCPGMSKIARGGVMRGRRSAATAAS